VLDSGVVQQVGSPIELYQRPANLFVAGFIGSPKMNFVPVKVDALDETGVTVSGQDVLKLRVPVSGGKVAVGNALTLGVRPHDLELAGTGAILGRVALTERLGNETIVNVELPSGASWLAVLAGDQALTRGESLAFEANAASAVLFDSAGKALQR
jgi:multiple sugar transport system ATP-binding protein